MDHGVWLWGISRVMADKVRDDIWACKGVSGGRKQVDLIHLAIFWVVEKEINRRAFEEVEANFDRVRGRWF